MAPDIPNCLPGVASVIPVTWPGPVVAAQIPETRFLPTATKLPVWVVPGVTWPTGAPPLWERTLAAPYGPMEPTPPMRVRVAHSYDWTTGVYVFTVISASTDSVAGRVMPAMANRL